MTLFLKRVSSNCTFSENTDLLMLIKPFLHFYRCFVQSVLAFSIVCWWSNLKVSDKSKLQKLVNICSKITGQQQLSVSNIYDRQVFKSAKQISNSHTHFLSPEYELLPSKKRFRIPVCKTNRGHFSFIPASVHLLNESAKDSNFLMCV